jgi:hypothetical protein
MRLRRVLVVWNSSAGQAGRHGTPHFVQTRRIGRLRRLLHICVVLAVIGMRSVVGTTMPRRRRLLTALVLAALPVILRDSMWGLMFFLVFVTYLSALVTPAPQPAR